MPLKAPESYELDRPHDTPSPRHSFESDASYVDELDPLKKADRQDTDDASQPLRSVFGAEKKSRPAWLDPQRRKGSWQRLCVPSRFCCTLILIFVATLVLLLGAGGLWVYKAGTAEDGASESWYPAPRGGTVTQWQDAFEKASQLVEGMTLVEKVNVTTGTGWSMDMCVGQTGTVDRVGFPSLCLQDGPLGLRFVDDATAWPAGITVGATWNKTLMRERGKAHGLEARLKGINVLLGPAMGPLGRLPAGGRNWEGFGSDPVLQGIAAAETILGIQSEGVMATAKHYVANEQEHFRQSWEWGTPNAISTNIDDRTLHEVYAWPFMDSIKAGVASVMCSYNQVNNSYACQNSKLLNGVLKDEFGFQGFVQSDWLAQRSGVASALAGLDMTMPGDGLGWQDGKSLWGHELTKAVLNESVPMERINDMTLRIVAAWYQLGQYDKTRWPNVTDGGGPNFSSWTNDEVGNLHPGSEDSKDTGVVNKFVPVRVTEEGGDHDRLARNIAAEGIVLVKNVDDLLPLSRNGTAANTRLGDGKLHIGIFGEDAYPNANGANACADRGCNEGTLASGWGSGAVEFPYLVAPAETLHASFDSQSVEIADWKTNDIEHVGGTAAAQDVCLVFINSDAGEGYLSWQDVKGDRNDLYPQKGGDKLVQEVAANCGGRDEKTGKPLSNTVVVLHTVGPTVLEKWIDLPGVKSVLIAHLPGQESGNALADVLFGDLNPSGRLPYTIPKSEADFGPDSKILRMPNAIVPQQNFTEGLYIDYRYLDKHNIPPRYEFGYGLSYTSFKLNSLFVHSLGVSGSEPKARPDELAPPASDNTVPSAETALWPAGMRKLKNYIYPYISSVSEAQPDGKYPYPAGYDTPHALSPAGGDEGGNPDLYTPVVDVQASLTNLGSIPGDCVVQMYVSFPSNVTSPSTGEPIDFPVKVLRGFDKIHVGSDNKSKRQPVKMQLTRRDLSYWDVGRQNWIMPQGDFTVYLGFSSRDLPVQSTFTAGFSLETGGGRE
ncbi:putative beta-glucosidase [Teratosphaeria nubilosa]|uniref:Probable beta-glucosidase E n=1 Tax=Teratosphaeria nubilosa TaxID=161662 RepID=A0A6G1LAK0_9PEZI|nr:putative beta-glucosidase [Teratosphaeria nubilosa]